MMYKIILVFSSPKATTSLLIPPVYTIITTLIRTLLRNMATFTQLICYHMYSIYYTFVYAMLFDCVFVFRDSESFVDTCEQMRTPDDLTIGAIIGTAKL